MINQESPYNILSVKKTMRIIEILASKNGEVLVTDLAKALDIHMSSADRYLLTLQTLGYVEKDEFTGRFRLTDKLLVLGKSLVVSHPLTVRYLDVMHTLAYEFNLTTHIMAFSGMNTVTLHKDLQLRNMAVNNAFFDHTRYHYCSAPGKLLLSTLPEEGLKEYFAHTKLIRFTKNTLTTEEDIRTELQFIRECGYSVNDGEWQLNSLTISFPLCVHGKIKGAMSIISDSDEKDKMLNPDTLEYIKRRTREPKQI